MLKKILIGIGILLVIIAAVFGYATYKVVDIANQKIEDMEPEFRQYLAMDTDAQNAYIETNLNKFWTVDDFKDASADVQKDAAEVERIMKEEAAQRELTEKIKADPEARAAGIAFGRSLIASLILDSDKIVADLTDTQKADLKREADQFEARLDAYGNILNKLAPPDNKD